MEVVGVETGEEHKADLYSLKGSRAQPMNKICIETWKKMCAEYIFLNNGFTS